MAGTWQAGKAQFPSTTFFLFQGSLFEPEPRQIAASRFETLEEWGDLRRIVNP